MQIIMKVVIVHLVLFYMYTVMRVDNAQQSLLLNFVVNQYYVWHIEMISTRNQ